MNKSAIFITFDGLCDPLGQSQILPYVKGLSAHGINMRILSCEKKKRLLIDEKNIQAQLNLLGIGWQYVIYEESGGLFSRWKYVRALTKLCAKEIKNSRPALLHCRSYLAALIGLKFKRQKQMPFVFDMRGLWADERIDGGIWQRNKLIHQLLYRYFKQKERQFVFEAAAIVSLTEKGKNEIQRLYPASDAANKTTVIPCCTDTVLFDPTTTKPADLKGIKPNGVLLVYSGSIGTWYCTKEMLDCVVVWQKKIPELQLLVLTKDTAEFEKIRATMDLPHDLILTASCSRDEVPGYLKRAKAAVFFIKPVYSKLASSPTKMAECWAMDLPVITNAGIGDNDALFANENGGILLHEFSETEYERTANLFTKLSPQKGHYRNVAILDFNLELAVNKYKKLYERIFQ